MKKRRYTFPGSEHSEKNSNHHNQKFFIVTSDTWIYAVALIILLLISFMSKSQTSSRLLNQNTKSNKISANNFHRIDQKNLKAFLG